MRTAAVKVTTRGNGEPSGLAMIMSQYFEQNIRDFPYKNSQALRLSGKLALEAVEGKVGITVDFKRGEIEIVNGCAPDAMLFVRGGIFDLTELATGGPGAFRKVLRRKMKVRSAWRHPLFALKLARFMSLPDEMRSRRPGAARPDGWKLAIGAGAIAALMGLAAYLLIKQIR